MNLFESYFTPPKPQLSGRPTVHLMDRVSSNQPKNAIVRQNNINRVLEAIIAGHNTFLRIEDEVGISQSTVKKACYALLDNGIVTVDIVEPNRKHVFSAVRHG